jgi:hypothetical protein
MDNFETRTHWIWMGSLKLLIEALRIPTRFITDLLMKQATVKMKMKEPTSIICHECETMQQPMIHGDMKVKHLTQGLRLHLHYFRDRMQQHLYHLRLHRYRPSRPLSKQQRPRRLATRR